MKVAINKCFGGFSLSPLAVKRLAELQGRRCHFFNVDFGCKPERYTRIEMPSEDTFMWSAFDTDDLSLIGSPSPEAWVAMTLEERQASNANYESHSLDSRPEDRSDPLLIQVIEELGEKASGRCAKLQIVEIPDGVEWEIEEYDGNEHVAERHRTWA